ncbi:DUF192 domain-containing protein [bacterium]|nr:DUF192 domain-containing protein [bacterium]
MSKKIYLENYKTKEIFLKKGDKKEKLCNSYVADSFWKRFRGLMMAPELPENFSLLLTKTNSIHMFFMNYPLDIIFISKNGEIIDILENFPKRALSKIYSKASFAIELKAGFLKNKNLAKGDILIIE